MIISLSAFGVLNSVDVDCYIKVKQQQQQQ